MRLKRPGWPARSQRSSSAGSSRSAERSKSHAPSAARRRNEPVQCAPSACTAVRWTSRSPPFNATLAAPTTSGWLKATLLNCRPRNSSVPLVSRGSVVQRAGPGEFQRDRTFHRPFRVRRPAKGSGQSDQVLRALRVAGDSQPVAPVARRIVGAQGPSAPSTCSAPAGAGSGAFRVASLHARQADRSRAENEESPFQTGLDAPDAQRSRQRLRAHHGAAAAGVCLSEDAAASLPEKRRRLRRPRPTNHRRCPAERRAATPADRQARCGRKRSCTTRIETVRPVERSGGVQTGLRRFHDAARYLQARFARPPVGRHDCVDRGIERALAQVPAMHAGKAKRPLQIPLRSRRFQRLPRRKGPRPRGWRWSPRACAESAPRTPWSLPSARRSASASEASCQVSANVAGRNRAEVPATVPCRRSVPAFCSGMGARIGSASRSMLQRPELSCSRLPVTSTSANGSFSAAEFEVDSSAVHVQPRKASGDATPN